MDETLNSHLPSGLNRKIPELISTDAAGAGDNQSSEVEASTALCPSEKPGLLALDLPSSKEEGQTVEAGAGNFVSSYSETVCGVLGEDMQETENGKGKEDSAGANVEEMREIEGGGESGDVANGKGAGSELLGATAGKVSGKLGDGGVVGMGSEKKDGAVGEDFRCSLEIELIDDTAVIGLSKIGMDSEPADRKNGKKEFDGKKEKRPRRKPKATKKGSEGDKNSSNLKVSAGNSTLYKGKEKRTKMVYSRKEMEALRYSNVKGQKKLWQEIYNAFSSSVKNEYDELGSFRHQKKQSALGLDPHRASGVLGELCTHSVDGDLEITTSAECTYDDNYSGEDGKCLLEAYDDVEDSDDEYTSIQRPAFLVEGEPDFDSGPPEDGLEYLRRVRWEAAQIPNVKVAKLDKSKLNREQSIYMPEIPDIERCPKHLLPLKEWEEEFLSDFSELRLALSHLDGSHNIGTIMVQPTSKLAHPVEADSPSLSEPTRPAGPTLSTILKMDPVTRVNTLKRRISLFESKDELSRTECLWLFSLCAAIDAPVDADTSAALRGLLRKCSKLRAGKSVLDDETVMLNLLVTVSGKYFGQSESEN